MTRSTTGSTAPVAPAAAPELPADLTAGFAPAETAISPDGLGTPPERVGGYLALLAARGVAKALAPVAGRLSRTAVGRCVFFAGNRTPNRAAVFDLPTHLHTITTPVLFLQGTAEPLIARQSHRYLPVIPGARLRWLPGANHVPISDDPGAVTAHILAFLHQAPPRR